MIVKLTKEEQAIEDRRRKELPKAIRGIKQAERLGLARRQERQRHRANVRIANQNVLSERAYAYQLQSILRQVYAMAMKDQSSDIVNFLTCHFSEEFLDQKEIRTNLDDIYASKELIDLAGEV